jgi:hypothetical protein
MLCLSPDTQFANNGDFVWIMQLQNGSAVVEGGLILSKEDDRIVLKVATGSLTAGVPYVEVPIGEWFCVEVAYAVDSGGGNDGSVTVYTNGARLALLSLDQQAIAGARFGAMSQSGDLRGMLYFDQIVCDDARVHPIAGGPKDSSSVGNETLLFTQSGFAFVGSGEILEVQAIDGGGSDARVKVYDAENPNFSEHDKRVDRRYNDAIPMRPVMFERGAYVQLSGTNPQAIVRIGMVNEFDFGGDSMPMVDEAA